VTPHGILADADFGRLKRRIIESTGLAYYADKDADLAQRISRRSAANHVRTCAAYLAILDGAGTGKQELDALIAELTIGETYFFRQAEHFRALSQAVFPDLMRRNHASRRLRIWSAGCATGAEAYSIALLLRNELGEKLAGWDVSIVGTDINRRFLAQAQEGRFAEWAFRECPPEVKQRCFTREGRDWVLRPEYRNWTSFHYHNLASDPAPSLLHGLCAFDLILCRNVMIYFGPELVRATVARFHECLVERGWLLVGHAEPNPEVFRDFRSTFEWNCTLYQKVEEKVEKPHDPTPETAEHPAPSAAPAAPEPPRVVAAAPETPPEDRIRALADRGQWEDAVLACETLLANNGMHAAAHFLHALVLEQTGGFDAAELALRRAIYLDRGFVLAHYHLGLALQRKGQLADARRSLANALRLAAGLDEGAAVEQGDGMTAGELKDLIRMQLEVLPA